jgi:putative redox protein
MGLQFEADVDGHKILMDVPERVGGHNAGTIPKPLMLAALSGCTGMDVAAILNKSATPFTSLTVDVDGDLTERHPITYTSIRVTYNMAGPDEGKDPAIAAVRRSIERLCGVAFLLKQVVPFSWTLIYNNQNVYQDQTEPTVLAPAQ